MKPIPVSEQFTDEQKDQVRSWFQQGKTQNEIGELLSIPRRTAGKLLKSLGLCRDRAAAGSIKAKSPLDDPDIVNRIRQLRVDHSLEQIAAIFNSSISAVQRLCDKRGINLPDNFSELQSSRIAAAWTDEMKFSASVTSKRLATPELRRKLSDGSKKLWEDGKYRRVQSVQRSKQSWMISSIQTHLYEILDDLSIAYFRERSDGSNDPETVIGPYNFDCVIPRSGKPTLLIECQGDYWHSLNKAVAKDAQKRSYIVNNFPDQYELKYLWEHEFKCKDKVVELLKYWLGITKLELIEFNFRDVAIIKIDVKTANRLLEKYHYLSGCGRGGILYGAFLGGKLIAVCAFSSLIRQNLPYNQETTRELSRFCIHPRYQMKNFGSWMISKCIKLLPDKIKLIISYCDTTFNHDGALYKACNFALDGTVKPDYWYTSEDGWVMHKKTLYNHAVKMGMTENAYAEAHGYGRTYGSEKLRFIYRRQ